MTESLPSHEAITPRSEPALSDFLRYALSHPDERFWQALCNWSGYGYVYVADVPAREAFPGDMRDTYYFDGRTS